jgi:hypothetical protein
MLSPFVKPVIVPVNTGLAWPKYRLALDAVAVKGAGDTTRLTWLVALL